MAKTTTKKIDNKKLAVKYTEEDFVGDPFMTWYLRGFVIEATDSSGEAKRQFSEIQRQDYAERRNAWALLGDQSTPWDTVWLHALDGDDQALFKLLSVFKEFAGTGWVLDRLADAARRSQDEEDDAGWSFLTQFGEALATQAKIHGNTDFRRTHYLVMNWSRPDRPLREMTDHQILQEFKREGLHNGAIDERARRALRKHRSRLELRKK